MAKLNRSYSLKGIFIFSIMTSYAMENNENTDKEWEFLTSYQSFSDTPNDRVLTAEGKVKNLIAKFSETEKKEDIPKKLSQNTVKHRSSYKVSSSGDQNSLSKNSSVNYKSIGYGSQKKFDSLRGSISGLKMGHNTQKKLLQALASLEEDGEKPLSPFNSEGRKTGTINGLKLATIDRHNSSKKFRKNSVYDIFSPTNWEVDKNTISSEKNDQDIQNIQSSDDASIMNLQLMQEENSSPTFNQLPIEPERSPNNQKILEEQIALFELSCSYCGGIKTIQEDLDKAFEGFKKIFETGWDEILKIKAGNNLGILYHRIGQSIDAINLLTECYFSTILNLDDGEYKRLSTLIENNLGVVYAQATKPDYVEALSFLKKAQESYIPAEFIKHNIGYVHLALQNYDEALNNFIVVAKVLKENPKIFEDEIKLLDIQYTIGKLYFDREEYTQALPYLQEAAEVENADAQFYLGLMHAQGYGVTLNHKTAASWYKKALVQKHNQAGANLDILYSQGNISYCDDISELKESAEQGDVNAQSLLGCVYYSGQGVEKSEETALILWKAAAAKGEPASLYNLGLMYKNGDCGLPKDLVEARKWFQKAADLGSVNAQYDLGRMYQQGRGGLDLNLDQAVFWYKKAAEQKLDDAKKALEDLAKKDHEGAQEALNEINQKNTVFKMVASPLKEFNQ